jgi:flagellar biosynthesis protein FlhB
MATLSSQGLTPIESPKMRLTEPSSRLYSMQGNGNSHRSKYNLIMWFFIAAIIVYLLVLAFRPAFARQVVNGQPTDSVDQLKAILTAIIGGIIVVLLIYLFRDYGYQ